MALLSGSIPEYPSLMFRLNVKDKTYYTRGITMKTFKIIFIISTILFLTLGVVLVLLQTLGLILADGAFITQSYEIVTPYAFTLCAISAVMGFLLNYSNGNNK
jgi:hypothetical protein